MMNAFDTTTPTTGLAHRIAELGYGAVGIYLTPSRSNRTSVHELSAQEVSVFSIWESGFPTTADYFTSSQGAEDGAAAAKYAYYLGQPSRTVIFAANADADLPLEVINAQCTEYQIAFRKATLDYGYYAGNYGSGLACQTLTDAGISHCGFLSQSTGWQGFEQFKNSPKLAIVQTGTTKVLGLDADADSIADAWVSTVTWRPAS